MVRNPNGECGSSPREGLTIVGRPMHVLLITSEPYPTPADPLSGIFQQQQAAALRRRGTRVGVLSPELQSLRVWKQTRGVVSPNVVWENDADVHVIRRRGVYWMPFSERGHQYAWTRVARSAFSDYAKRHGQPDVIHAHNTWPAGVAALAISGRYRIPYCITEHSSAYSRGAVPTAVMGRVRAALRAASVRATVSRKLAELLESQCGQMPGGYRVVPNLVGSDFEQECLSLAARRTVGRPYRFVNVGNLLPIKGHDVLLEAFRQAFANDPDVELRIIGDGPLRSELAERAIALGIASQVHFLGQLDRGAVRHELTMCDAYVHSSRYETFGVALIEALCCGRPVVSTACGGPEDVVTAQNGKLVPSGDPGALGAAMTAVRAASGDFDPAAIRRDCLERFSEEAVVRRLTEIYAEVGRSQEEG